MTYELLTSSSKLPDIRDNLNGITTRRESLDFVRHHGGTGTSRGINGQFFGEDFTTGDQCHAVWLPCDRLDNAVDMTLRLHLFATAGVPGGSDQCAFDVRVTYVDITDDTELSTTTDATLSTGDVDLGANARTYIPACTVTIPNGSVDGDTHLIGFEIERVAPSGTDYVGDVSLVGVEVQYTIER